MTLSQPLHHSPNHCIGSIRAATGSYLVISQFEETYSPRELVFSLEQKQAFFIVKSSVGQETYSGTVQLHQKDFTEEST